MLPDYIERLPSLLPDYSGDHLLGSVVQKRCFHEWSQMWAPRTNQQRPELPVEREAAPALVREVS